MWYAPTVKAAATAKVLTLSEMKSRLRVDITDDDTLIGNLIDEVTAEAETWCGLFILPQTVTAKCESFADFASLPVAPLVETASPIVTYVDAAGASQTLSSSVYELRVDGLMSQIALKPSQVWPSIQTGSRIALEVATGFASVPLPIRAAIALKVAERYENRENAAAGNMTDWDSLLVNHRRTA